MNNNNNNNKNNDENKRNTSPFYFYSLCWCATSSFGIDNINTILLHSRKVQCQTISYRDSFSRICRYANGVVVTFGCKRPWPGSLTKIILWPGQISWWLSKWFIISSVVDSSIHIGCWGEVVRWVTGQCSWFWILCLCTESEIIFCFVFLSTNLFLVS